MMKTKPRTPSAHPKGPFVVAPKPLDCAKCARSRASHDAIREDFKRAQDHHAARVAQDCEALDSLQKRLDAARDYASGMLQSEDSLVRSAGIVLLGVLKA